MKTSIHRITTLLVSLLLFSGSLLQAQVRGNGHVVNEARNPGTFTSIEVNNSADIYITKGSSNSITVTADENLLPIIRTEVSEGVLKVSSTKSYSRARTLEVHVTMTRIDKLTSSGSGDIYCRDAISGDGVIVRLNGSGDLQAEFAVKNLELQLNGSGDVELSGVRGKLEIRISGSGDVEADNLQLESCRVKILGSGDVRLRGSTVELSIRQVGSGDVNAYSLKAVNVEVSNSGSGDIIVNAIEKLNVELN
ncbi:MAG: DUF2807 domain-containing protein, partial [Bacteroidales bacterium]|nr:DUF2807 domain-containing protein [Bacteroidales bacterium]